MSRVRHMLMVPVLALAMVFAAAVPAKAEVKIAVVDFDRLMNESTAAKGAQKKLIAQRNALQKELDQKEEEFGKKGTELSKERTKLKPEEMKAKLAEFNKQFQATRKELIQQKETLDKSLATANMNLRKEVLKIVAEIAQAEKYDLVLSSQNVVIAEKDMDITAKVLAKLNATVKEVPLKK